MNEDKSYVIVRYKGNKKRSLECLCEMTDPDTGKQITYMSKDLAEAGELYLRRSRRFIYKYRVEKRKTISQ